MIVWQCWRCKGDMRAPDHYGKGRRSQACPHCGAVNMIPESKPLSPSGWATDGKAAPEDAPQPTGVTRSEIRTLGATSLLAGTVGVTFGLLLFGGSFVGLRGLPLHIITVIGGLGCILGVTLGAIGVVRSRKRDRIHFRLCMAGLVVSCAATAAVAVWRTAGVPWAEQRRAALLGRSGKAGRSGESVRADALPTVFTAGEVRAALLEAKKVPLNVRDADAKTAEAVFLYQKAEKDTRTLYQCVDAFRTALAMAGKTDLEKEDSRKMYDDALARLEAAVSRLYADGCQMEREKDWLNAERTFERLLAVMALSGGGPDENASLYKNVLQHYRYSKGLPVNPR